MQNYISNHDIIIIPYDKLKQDTLHSLIQEYVTRDGTDYGEAEASFEAKTKQVLNQIKSGKAFIIFDQLSETANIVSADDLRKHRNQQILNQ